MQQITADGLSPERHMHTSHTSYDLLLFTTPN